MIVTSCYLSYIWANTETVIEKERLAVESETENDQTRTRRPCRCCRSIAEVGVMALKIQEEVCDERQNVVLFELGSAYM